MQDGPLGIRFGKCRVSTMSVRQPLTGSKPTMSPHSRRESTSLPHGVVNLRERVAKLWVLRTEIKVSIRCWDLYVVRWAVTQKAAETG
jgi:hypothetical protein